MSKSPEQQYRRMQYVLSMARVDRGIKLKDITKETGIGKAAYHSVVYNPGGSSILKVIEVAEAFGYELVLRKKKEATD